MVLGRWLRINILLDAAAAHFLDLLHESQVDAVLVIYIAVGIGACHNLGTEFLSLLNSISSNVAGAGDNNGLILVVKTCISQHQLGEIQEAIAGSLGTGQAAAVVQALAGQHACIISIADALVLSIEVANLAAAYADITSRYVGVQTDVTAQLGHEALAEAHDFSIRLALRIKVGAALAAADWQGSQGILEHLLKAQELDDAQIYGWMEAQAALVRSNGTVELYAVTLVYMHLACIISPRNAEHYNALRLYDTLKNSRLLILRVLLQYRSNRSQNLFYSIVELGLAWIFSLNLCDDFFNITCQNNIPPMNNNRNNNFMYTKIILYHFCIQHTAKLLYYNFRFFQ